MDDLEFSKSVIMLLKNAIIKEENASEWRYISENINKISDYLNKIGLEIIFDDIDGFCYVKQISECDLPKLTPRQPLSFHASLLLVLLRKKLGEFDKKNIDAKFVISKDELIEDLSIFLKIGTDEAKSSNNIQAAINKISEIGILRQTTSETYEVLRIIRSFVDGNLLCDLEQKLIEYKENIPKKEV